MYIILAEVMARQDINPDLKYYDVQILGLRNCGMILREAAYIGSVLL